MTTTRKLDLSPEQRAALADRLRLRGLPSAEPPIPRRPEGAPAVLSHAQQRLWFIDRLEPSSAVYSIQHGLRLLGPLDVAALRGALEAVVARHEVLRTRIVACGGSPQAVVDAPGAPVLRMLGLGAVGAAARADEARVAFEEEAERPFDLAAEPPLRALLAEVADDEAWLLLDVHHIAADGWSMAVLGSEIAALYQALLEGRTPALPPLALQYADYAAWQRERVGGARRASSLAYWTGAVHGASRLDLPCDRPRPATPTFRGGAVHRRLPRRTLAQVRALASAQRATPFMVLLAAWGATLGRLGGQDVVAVGTGVAGRVRAELEPLIGLFVNTLVMRVDLEGDPSFATLVERTRDMAVAGLAHQELPFDVLVDALAPSRAAGDNPLFRASFVYQNVPHDPERWGPLRVEALQLPHRTSKVDLFLSMHDDADGLSASMEYSADLFEPASAQAIFECFLSLLDAALAQPHRRVRALPLRDGAAPSESTVRGDAESEPALAPHVIAGWAQRTPEAVAVRCAGASVTYLELDRRANQLAHRLRALGAGPERAVAVAIDRSDDWVVALIACWRAGAAYLPVDARWPQARVQALLAEAEVAVVVGEAGHAQMPRVVPWRERAALAALPATPPEVVLHPASLAYVLFTSGSTGEPKGVTIDHRGLSHLLATQRQMLTLRADDAVLQLAAPSFDASIFDLVWALGAGARLVIPAGEARHPGPALAETIDAERVTVLDLVPAVAAALPHREHATVRLVLFAGDALDASLVSRWQRAGRALFNGYGPTETTVAATFGRCAAGGDRPSIGLPVPASTLAVLDPEMRPVPRRVAGELWVIGPHVGRGYLGRPARTAERFLPWHGGPAGARMYRTGDVVRMRADGSLDFLCRADQQLKLRGQRLEAGEIEAALRAHPGVTDAAVVLQGEGASAQLAAFVVAAPVADGDSSEEAHHLAWESVFEQAYAAPAAGGPLEDDFSGWTSSFTGAPLPFAEMRSWVEEVVERAVALEPGREGAGDQSRQERGLLAEPRQERGLLAEPRQERGLPAEPRQERGLPAESRRVLEIGCGTGLVLLRMAARCQRYIGVDVSAHAIARLRAEVELRGLAGQVALHHAPAHALQTALPAGERFDLVILSSVVQYFSGERYLRDVLDAAAVRVAPGGAMLVADVRDLELLPAFALAVEAARAEGPLPAGTLEDRARLRVRDEVELAVAPAFFQSLRARWPRLVDVAVLPRASRVDNELTRYRYDVVLRFDACAAAAGVVIDGAALSLDALRARLAASGGRQVTVTGLLDARHERERAAGVGPAKGTSVHVADLGEVARALGLAVEVRRGAGGAWATLEARFAPAAAGEHIAGARAPLPVAEVGAGAGDAAAPLDAGPSTNAPARGRALRRLPAELTTVLERRLPPYMVPGAIAVVDALPRLTSGKVDRRALARTLVARPQVRFVEPTSTAELRVAAVWERLLQVPRVGLDDGFFRLGGNSLRLVELHAALVAMGARGLALTDLFQHTTVRAQAALLRWPMADDARAEPSVSAAPVAVSAPTAATIAAGPAVPADAIAVVGAAIRFPGARSPAAFWDNLRAGVESVRRFDRAAQRQAGVPQALLDDPAWVPARAVLDDPDHLDPELFGLQPGEAALMDPQQRLLLDCAQEALECAGLDAARRHRVGVFAGTPASTYATQLAADPALRARHGVQVDLLNGGDFVASRIAFQLDLAGPAVSVQTACSTSLVAIHMACRSLLDGECDVALAGGATVEVPLAWGYLHQEGSILSRDGRCRAFDASASGTVGGDGGGVVVLRPLRDAIDAGDDILAVVRGSAINNDGARKLAFTAPGLDGQVDVIRRTLAAAGLAPEDIGYVEAHGTGTPLGDAVELAALRAVFAGLPPGRVQVGSVKANLGHLGHAAGLAGFLKAAFVARHGEVPPSLHLERPGAGLDAEGTPLRAASASSRLEPGGPRHVAVSSFGLGGTNAHAVLEAPPPPRADESRRGVHLLAWSARSAGALLRRRDDIAAYLDAQAPTPADVAATLARRRAHAHRQAVVCGARAVFAAPSAAGVVDGPQRALFLFPGGASASVGLLRRLHGAEPAFRAAFERCARGLAPYLRTDLHALLFDVDDEARAMARHDQPLSFVASYGLAALLRETWGVEPALLLGHSLGAYAAATVAGLWSLEDALRLVAARGRLMQELPAGAMLAVALDAEQAQAECGDGVELAVVNGPRMCVLGGPVSAVARLEARLAARGVLTRAVRAGFASHTSMVDPVLDAMGEELARVSSWAPPSLPWMCARTGVPVDGEAARTPAYWLDHLRTTVRFDRALRAVAAEPDLVVTQLGDGVLDAPVRALVGVDRMVTVLEDGGGEAEHAVATAAARLWTRGVPVDLGAPYAAERRRRLPLPAHPRAAVRCWVDAPAVPVAGAGASEAAGAPQPCLACPTVDAPTDVGAAAEVSADPVPPELVDMVTALWRELLGASSVDPDSDLFALGASSLQVAQLGARLRERLPLALPLSEVFAARTPRALAARIAGRLLDELDAMPDADPGDPK